MASDNIMFGNKSKRLFIFYTGYKSCFVANVIQSDCMLPIDPKPGERSWEGIPGTRVSFFIISVSLLPYTILTYILYTLQTEYTPYTPQSEMNKREVLMLEHGCSSR